MCASRASIAKKKYVKPEVITFKKANPDLIIAGLEGLRFEKLEMGHRVYFGEHGIANIGPDWMDSSGLNISTIEVLETHSKLGTFFMRSIIDFARSKGFKFVSLKSVLYAIKFYKKLGFVHDDRYKDEERLILRL